MADKIIIIGAGLAGLSAALKSAGSGYEVLLVSSQPSERAQSVMAEGGINAALDTKGEMDSVEQHFQDTMKAGCFMASEPAVKRMTEAAPGIVRDLKKTGVQFNLDENGEPDLRNFGGQKKKRTAFAKSDTGKQIMTALIDEARKYEVSGRIKRYMHHSFITLLFSDKQKSRCAGCIIRDDHTGEEIHLTGDAVITATGGMHGLFGNTTGSRLNTGEVTAELFRLGVPLINPEFIQYHPTTAESGGKRMLISEAARGEGGRLYADRNGEKWYFMEEKYPDLGNLMPRDITSREIWNVSREYPVFLDMTGLSKDVFENKLSSILDDCLTYLHIDPRKEPVPVSPGIHYFMGGLYTDDFHRTNIPGLFAAGECCGLYHGANRLGGNSLLGAIHGGQVAAESACEYVRDNRGADTFTQWELFFGRVNVMPDEGDAKDIRNMADGRSDCVINVQTTDKELKLIQETLTECMGVVRNGENMAHGLEIIKGIRGPMARLGEAVCLAGINRLESRGAHFREDHPEMSDEYCRCSIVQYDRGEITMI